MTVTLPPRRAVALACCLLLVPALAYAQGIGGGDISADVNNVATWVIGVIRAVAVLILIGGFIAFATGRFFWGAGIIMAIGLIGAVKSDVIATTLFGS